MRKLRGRPTLPTPTRARLLVHMAFLFAAQSAQQTTATAVHVHGGYGFTLEHDVQLFHRRAKVGHSSSATHAVARWTSRTC